MGPGSAHGPRVLHTSPGFCTRALGSAHGPQRSAHKHQVTHTGPGFCTQAPGFCTRAPGFCTWAPKFCTQAPGSAHRSQVLHTGPEFCIQALSSAHGPQVVHISTLNRSPYAWSQEAYDLCHVHPEPPHPHPARSRTERLQPLLSSLGWRCFQKEFSSQDETLTPLPWPTVPLRRGYSGQCLGSVWTGNPGGAQDPWSTPGLPP